MGVFIKKTATPRLPSAYQEVEYLQHSGTQYIDTGWTPNVTSRGGFIIKTTSSAVKTASYLCGTTNSSNTGLRLMIYNTYLWYLTTTTYAQPVITSLTINETVKLTTEYDGSTHFISIKNEYGTGLSYTNFNTNNSSINKTFLLWAQNYGANVRKMTGSHRIYYFKGWHEGFACELIPCYRKSDSKPGMYDIVNGAFLVNQATGTDFAVGPDISPVSLQPISINIKMGNISPTPTNVLDTVGYHNNSRISLNSTNADKVISNSGTVATGQIPISPHDIIRCRGILVNSSSNIVSAYFNTSRTYISGQNSLTSSVPHSDIPTIAVLIYIDGEITIMCTENANGYISFSGLCSDGANVFVTKNQPLPE